MVVAAVAVGEGGGGATMRFGSAPNRRTIHTWFSIESDIAERKIGPVYFVVVASNSSGRITVIARALNWRLELATCLVSIF